MFARIATFHGSPNRVREGSRVVEEITPEMQKLDGFQRAYLFVDGKSGTALAVTFWDDEEQAKRGPAASVGEKVGRALGATDRFSIETYEVGSEVSEGRTGGKFARVSEYHGSPAKIGDGIRQTKKTEADLKAMQGFQHAYLLVDRKSGKATTITLWDSETALTRTSSGAGSLREDITSSFGATEKADVSTFEVAGNIPQAARKAA